MTIGQQEPKIGTLLHLMMHLLTVAFLIAVQPATSAMAEKASPGGLVETFVTTSIESAGVEPLERTPEEMLRAELELQRTGFATKPIKIPFKPTMNRWKYEEAKKAASGQFFQEGPPFSEAPAVASTLPVLKRVNIDGVNQTEAGGFRPPDTHGVAGKHHFTEITNSHLDIYSKTPPNALVMSVSLASFFGYTTQAIFDPRVVYDLAMNRWVMTAEAFPESSTVQYHFIAVSKTQDPLKSYWIYRIDVNTLDNDDFWDFPQLGMDKNALIVTANIFGPAPDFAFRDTRMFALPKSILYSGQPLPSIRMHTGLVGTLAPPIVLDQNSRTYLIAAPSYDPPGGTQITKYTLRHSGDPPAQTLTSSVITVPMYSIPPNATQPGTTDLLDSSDARFVNASTQIGNSLFQVHTIDNLGRPTPRWYQFNTNKNTIIQSGVISASDSSHDWNASIAANSSKDVFVVWSSTDPPAGTNAQVRFSGRRGAEPPGIDPIGKALFTSPTFYNPSADRVERWGDYSAVTVDPVLPVRAWIVNEKIDSQTIWGSRIGLIAFPQ